jgi:AbrB family looped-hinge helix DNA binding protein
MVPLQDTNLEIKTYPVRLRDRGQITVPQTVREQLQVVEGDMLVLLQLGDLVLLTPRHPQTPQLADKFAALLADEQVTLADLLLGLAEERQTIWQERQTNA